LRTETSKSLDRTEFETSPLFASARKFELEYLDAAEKILAKGPEEKLQDPQDDEILVEMKNIYCINKTREVQEGQKYSCKICEKAFRSPEFVHKHIRNKHEDRLIDKFN
jgi:hypothetical protein